MELAVDGRQFKQLGIKVLHVTLGNAASEQGHAKLMVVGIIILTQVTVCPSVKLLLMNLALIGQVRITASGILTRVLILPAKISIDNA